jgi:hypothetical protein
LVDLRYTFELHLGDEAILERPSLPLDPSLGLRREGRDGFDVELAEDPADMRREADTRQLLFVAPAAVTTEQGAVAVLIDSGWGPVPPEYHVQELEVADGVLVRPEQHPQHRPRGIIGGVEK